MDDGWIGRVDLVAEKTEEKNRLNWVKRSYFSAMAVTYDMKSSLCFNCYMYFCVALKRHMLSC